MMGDDEAGGGTGVAGLADAAELLASLALSFGEIDRTACWHPDGRPETDSTHTVMLAWLAPALAALLYPDLDAGLVAQFAIVHDAVEVFAGDTPTLRITPAGRAAKKERERAAAGRWQDLFLRSLPWLPAMITRYEDQAEPEARFVRAVDKLCPALVHMSNGAADVAAYGITAGEVESMRAQRHAEMAEYAPDFPEIIALKDKLSARLARMLRQREAPPLPIR
jgi:5'-deoxynucleotidase YfbR-like HD superfamily hydrolase